MTTYRSFILLMASLLPLLITLSNVTEAHGRGKLRPPECNPRSTYRCSATSHKKPCMFFCSKRLCVSPGTNGNEQVCPCYNNWKTKEGGPKCP